MVEFEIGEVYNDKWIRGNRNENGKSVKWCKEKAELRIEEFGTNI